MKINEIYQKRNILDDETATNIIIETGFTGNMVVKTNGHDRICEWDVDGQLYRCKLNIYNIPELDVQGIAIYFGPADDEFEGEELTNFKHPPQIVSSGMQHIRKTVLQQMMDTYQIDFIVYEVKDNVERRIKHYDRIAGASKLTTTRHRFKKPEDKKIVGAPEVVVTFLTSQTTEQKKQIRDWVLQNMNKTD